MKTKPQFILRCDENSTSHVRFYLKDPAKVHCGTIVMVPEHLNEFLKLWKGKVDWNGKEVQGNPGIMIIELNEAHPYP